MRIATDTLRGFDPEIREARKVNTQQAVTLEEGVFLYVADMITRLGDNGTVAMARSVFGNVGEDPKTKTKVVLRNGRLFNWLATLNAGERPIYVKDITSAHVTAWRVAWKDKSDLTAAQRWSMVRGFFKFCESQDWISDSPARKLKPLTVKKGGRTAIFTDDQYQKILDAIALYDPENVPGQTRKAWQQRLLIFVELLRWSGMALVDGVQWRPELVDADGVLRYRRQKSGELAIVPLPNHVVALLRDIPLERDSAGANMPFRSNRASMMSDTAKWNRRLSTLFHFAGIKTVRNEQGRQREPHPHMLRDTFAVWHLRHGAHLKSVSKMLGHSKTITTERSYLPWVKELEEAHIADARRSLAQIQKANGKVVNIATQGK